MCPGAPDGGTSTRAPRRSRSPTISSPSISGASVPERGDGSSTAEPVDIDGVSGVMITYNLWLVRRGAAKNEDMVVNQAGNTYDIALNTPPPTSPRTSRFAGVLNSWTWA